MHTARSIQTAPSAAWSLDAFSRTFTGKAALVVCASLFVAACAHLIVPLPFTPVPLTLSDLAVLLVGLALGPELAFAALVLYLAEGAAGLPVFSPTGPGGLVQLFGFTGGYLLAYPFAAALAGYVDRLLLRRLPHVTRFAAAAMAALAATSLIMSSGAAWLGIVHHLSLATTLKLAVLPFLPGQMVKVAVAAGLFTTLNRWRRA
jgi:biotin transport system substrate-specific component